jgi:hypothetical protein
VNPKQAFRTCSSVVAVFTLGYALGRSDLVSWFLDGMEYLIPESLCGPQKLEHVARDYKVVKKCLFWEGVFYWQQYKE